ncbi:MAG: ribonuclease R [Rhodomicrobiaceae bacterium]
MSETKKAARKAGKKGEAPLPTKEAILEFIRSTPAKTGKREIARAFNLKGDSRIFLKKILRELAEDGLIAKRRKSLRGRGELAPVTVLEIVGNDENGDLYATPADWNEEDEGPAPRVLMTLKRGRTPGMGDHVLSRIEPVEAADGYRYTASPIKILPNNRTRQLGVYRKGGDGGVIEPIDKKQLREWRILPGETEGAQDGELVRFELPKAGRTLSPRARIVERLGHPESERALSMIAIESYGLPDIFPESIEIEAAQLKPASMRGREDLRKLPLITIDPADAKDHDDAVWAAPDEDEANKGGYVVIVAIADVAHYVQPGTALDKEALKRGNSVYFPDRVVPMLPETLSNELCSLKEDVDRPCLAVRMIFDAQGHKRNHRFIRGMMRSAAKLSYPEAQAAIDGRASERAGPVLETVLKPLWAAYDLLHKARLKRAPLDLDLPERKIILDEQGRVARVTVPERLDAHRLIEEFMIQANVAAAEALEAAKSPLLYRIHDAPSEEKLKALAEFLATIDITMPKAGLIKPSQFNRVLDRTKDGEFSELVNEVILRSQAQAEYSPSNLGHFGLNLRRYAHFTSPIRRYADLIVHRALIRALKLGPGGLTDAEIELLPETAEQISQAERRAMAAERETVDRLIATHLAGQIGASFNGRISGVTRSGLFVKLADTGADGFIPASTIGQDYYIYSEADHALIGERTGETFRLGDNVEVQLVEAFPAAGALRFKLVSEGRFDLKLSRKRRVRGNAPRRKRR